MILYSHWCSLPIATRIKIAGVFGITKKGPTQVDSNIIKSDGYLVEDIESALSVEAMQKYLGVSETDIAKLWLAVVTKAQAPSISVLPPAEAKKFTREYKSRKKNAKN